MLGTWRTYLFLMNTKSYQDAWLLLRNVNKSANKQISKGTSWAYDSQLTTVSVFQTESRKYIFIVLQEYFQNVLRVFHLHSTRRNRSEYIFTVNSKFEPKVFKQIYLIENVLRRYLKYGYFLENLSIRDYIMRYNQPGIVV